MHSRSQHLAVDDMRVQCADTEQAWEIPIFDVARSPVLLDLQQCDSEATLPLQHSAAAIEAWLNCTSCSTMSSEDVLATLKVRLNAETCEAPV